MAFERTTIKIPSATSGWDLDTWRYFPTGGASKPLPVVIMAHGFSSNKLMSLAHYAEAFAGRGYACLVFDYRRWGASDGTPRNILSVTEQLEDYGTVVKYARQQAELDPQRVILWGTSFSGGHVIKLASEPSINAVAVVAQCPFVGTSTRPAASFGLLKTIVFALADALKQYVGLQPVYIPAAGPPGTAAVLTAEGTLDGFVGVVADPKNWSNKVAASAFLPLVGYKPGAGAASVTCPLVIIAPEDDIICTLPGAEAVAKAAQSIRLVKVPDSGHFDVYPDHKDHDLSLKEQLEFLARHVPV